MREFPRIATDRLILRLPVEPDVSSVLEFFEMNRKFLTPWNPAWPNEFFTEDYWLQRVERFGRDFDQELAVRLFLFYRDLPNEIAGSITFNQIHRGSAQYCVLGYSLAEAAQGKGLMFEALSAAIPYMFNEFKLHRIMANYIPRNERSGRLLKRLGFIVEGYARDYLLINGKWEDHILTSLTNTDWVRDCVVG